MDTVEIVIGEDGRIVEPVGVRLRLPARFVVRDEPEESAEERTTRIEEFFRETKELLQDVPRKDLRGDPRAAKYYRMGLLD